MTAQANGFLQQGGRLGSAGLRQALLWQMLRTLIRLGFAAAAAMALGHLVVDGTLAPRMLILISFLIVLVSVAGWVADRVEYTAENNVSAKLRDRACVILQSLPARTVRALPAGELIVSIQRHPEAIAALVIGHAATRQMMMFGSLAAAGALVFVSWEAAATVVLLTPVMIIFFILVGDTIRKRAELQERALGRLAGQFADRIRALPTILANHAVESESNKLHARLEAYSANTMSVLQVAFLNTGVIDFFSSLSIAILAVLLGLGHLQLATFPGFGHLDLWQSLFVLMIAPDYFMPLRRYAERYHAKAEGLAAAAALDRLLGTQSPLAPALPQLAEACDASAFPSHGLIAIVGPSGSGKSTLLRGLASLETGIEPLAAELISSRLSWISTDIFVPDGTLADVISWGASRARPGDIMVAASQVGLLDDELLPGGLNAPVVNGGINLSGGQRLRVAVARALLTDRIVLADEPTAKVDDLTAAMIRNSLCAMAERRLVIVATHDRNLVRRADRMIKLESTGMSEVTA